MPLNKIEETHGLSSHASQSLYQNKKNENDYHILSIITGTSNDCISEASPSHSNIDKTKIRNNAGVLDTIKVFFGGESLHQKKEKDELCLEKILNKGNHLRNEIQHLQQSQHSEGKIPLLRFTYKHGIGFGCLLIGSIIGGGTFFLHKQSGPSSPDWHDKPQSDNHPINNAMFKNAINTTSDISIINDTTEINHIHSATVPSENNLNTTHSVNVESFLNKEQVEHIDIAEAQYISSPHNIEKRKFIPKKKENITLNSDDVKIQKLTYCHEERESISLTKTMRIISKTLKNPISALIKEGRVIINYNIYGNGCIGNESFDEMAKNIESGIQDLLSSLPVYGRARLVTLLTASILDMVADAIDNKSLSLFKAYEIQTYVINLSKDLIISALTKQFSQQEDYNGIDNVIKSINFDQDKIYLNTGSVNNKIEVSDYNHHLTNTKSKAYFFYNNKNKWVIKSDHDFMENIKESFNKAEVLFGKEADIDFLQNSGPELYRDGLLINHKGSLYSLVEGELLPVSEIEIADNIFRYIVNQYGEEKPIITKQGKWIFEDITSIILDESSVSFLEEYYQTKDFLVDKHITHKHVGPIDDYNGLYYDKNHNRYIKHKNKYIALKTGINNDHYLSGEYDVLPLKKAYDKLFLQNKYLDGVYEYHHEKLDTLPLQKYQQKYYFDNTVIDEVKNKLSLWKKGELFYKHNMGKNVVESHIPGALHIIGDDYIPYKGNLIKIKSNGDDTFFLGYGEKEDELIKVYKNQKSNTYYLMPKKNKSLRDSKNYNSRSGHCISKRQIFSLCNADFSESINLSDKLKDNMHQGITIDINNENLIPFEDVNGFYRLKDKPNDIYYHFRDGVFFHAEEIKEVSTNMIPEYFSLYGKKNDGSIDRDIHIQNVCVIKDFDTHKIVLSTSEEAMNTIFGIDLKVSKALSNTQESEMSKIPFNIDDFRDDLSFNYGNSDMDDTYALFDRCAKKNVFSKGASINMIEMLSQYKIDDLGFSEFKRLTEVEYENMSSDTLKVKYNIFVEALQKSTNDLNYVIMESGKSNSALTPYLYDKAKIRDPILSEFFKFILHKKFKRMHFILSNENKNNIILIDNKYPSKGMMPGMTLGFSYSGDPLDRIFINSAVIPDKFNPNLNIAKDFQERERYINSISNTMLHEAVHATGAPFDYFYVCNTKSLDYINLEDSFKQIENSIMSQELTRDKHFIYLCNLYFASNPIYKRYTIESLTLPDNLSTIFRQDDHFKVMLLLNNPDSISHIIKDFIKYHRQQ